MPAQIITCRECNEDETKREQFGCYHETPEPIWSTDYCPICNGKDDLCDYCQGSNEIPVHRCPHALASDVSALLPYFMDWYKSDRVAWPNGRGRLHQPVKLAQAFDILGNIVSVYIDEKAKE